MLMHKVKRGKVTQEKANIRGLEKYLNKSIKKGKNMAWDTVLLEQDKQELSGYYNEQHIVDLYEDTTYAFHQKSWQKDEAVVRAYLLTPRMTKLMMGWLE
jgi:hypothetical protein